MLDEPYRTPVELVDRESDLMTLPLSWVVIFLVVAGLLVYLRAHQNAGITPQTWPTPYYIVDVSISETNPPAKSGRAPHTPLNP